MNNVGDSHLNLKFSACSRSLNLPLSSSVKMMGESLSLPPPHPACTKPGPAADVARKGRKIFNHQEQVHSLRLLHNNYLQWRFANAKAEASLRAQTSDTERKLHSLGVKISDLCDAVERKRIELGLLRRTKTISTIVETHMPYLDEWSALEEEYSTSLSATTHALSNSLVRLPVGGNVQADIREVGESLNSAIKVMEMIGIHVQSFMPKANEMDTVITELVRLVGGERVLIEECGDLLFKTFTSQVEDCSLRGLLMQLQNNNQVPNCSSNGRIIILARRVLLLWDRVLSCKYAEILLSKYE